MNFETLIYTQDGYTGILTINRPQALNALNADVLKRTRKCLQIILKQIKRYRPYYYWSR